MIKWKQKNLSQVFAEPVTAVRQCAVNMKKKDGKRILTFMDCAYKRCKIRAPVKFIKKRTSWEARKSSRSLQAADCLFKKHALTNSR